MFRPVVVVAAVLIAVMGQADVYKIVDEDGNVTYTDRAPEPGAQPMEFQSSKGIEAAVERPAIESGDESSDQQAPGDEDLEPVNNRALKKLYSDFRIIQPVPDQTFRGGSNPATLAWQTGAALKPGMKVVFYIDGRRHSVTRKQVVSTGRLARGEHKVKADLLSKNNRRLVSTAEIRFYIHEEYHWINLPAIGIR